MGDDGIGNNLFVGRIMLGRGAWKKEIVPARQKRAEITLRLEVQSLKGAQLIEKAAFNYQNIFAW